jgi:hypothetical protein
MSNYITNTAYPLIPRHPNYLLDSKIVSFHSEDRDPKKWPKPSHFEVTLPDELKNVQSIRLLDIYLRIKNIGNNLNQTHIYMEIENYNTIDELEPHPQNTNASHHNTYGGRKNSAFAVIPIKPKEQLEDNEVQLVQDTRNGSLANLSFYNPVIERIPKIKVTFRYHDGTPVDFSKDDEGNNYNLNFRLEFNMLRNQQQENMVINVPPGNFS